MGLPQTPRCALLTVECYYSLYNSSLIKFKLNANYLALKSMITFCAEWCF